MSDLGGRAVRGGAVTLVGQALRLVLMIGAAAILGRILTPDDYGIVAMVTAVTAFIARFKDMGLSASTVQHGRITHDQISALFWINVLFGLLLTVLTMVLAPLLALMYGDARITGIAVAMSLVFLFAGLTAQHEALLTRQMSFTTLVIVQIVATALAIGLAIAAALAGAGFWSLVLLQIILGAGTMVGAWMTCRWRPGRPGRSVGVRSMVTFGGYLTGFNILHSLVRSFDKILLGVIGQANVVGLYSRASFILLIPIHQMIGIPITQVAVPVLSRLQDEPERFASYFRRGVLFVAAVVFPGCVFAFAAADTIVVVWLGDQWTDAGAILRALTPVGFMAVIDLAASWGFIALGHTRRQFAWGVIASVVTIGAMIVGSGWGGIGVAIGYSIAVALVNLPGLAWCLRTAPVGLGEVLGVLWRPCVASIVAGAVILFVDDLVRARVNVLAALPADLLAFAIAYGLTWLVLPEGLATLREVAALAGAFRRRVDIAAAETRPPEQINS